MITAANKHYPILMTMECPLTLTDYTFAVSTKQKLVPPVYATIEIKEGIFTYKGLTHSAMRSLKHGKADAFSCMEDLKYVIGGYGTGE